MEGSFAACPQTAPYTDVEHTTSLAPDFYCDSYAPTSQTYHYSYTTNYDLSDYSPATQSSFPPRYATNACEFPVTQAHDPLVSLTPPSPPIYANSHASATVVSHELDCVQDSSLPQNNNTFTQYLQCERTSSAPLISPYAPTTCDYFPPAEHSWTHPYTEYATPCNPSVLPLKTERDSYCATPFPVPSLPPPLSNAQVTSRPKAKLLCQALKAQLRQKTRLSSEVKSGRKNRIKSEDVRYKLSDSGTPEEEERRRRRRERNKVAATKCRNKKKAHVVHLSEQSGLLENSNAELRNEMTTLRAQETQLMQLLQQHVCVLNNKPEVLSNCEVINNPTSSFVDTASYSPNITLCNKNMPMSHTIPSTALYRPSDHSHNLLKSHRPSNEVSQLTPIQCSQTSLQNSRDDTFMHNSSFPAEDEFALQMGFL